jgi:hypothetical protein
MLPLYFKYSVAGQNTPLGQGGFVQVVQPRAWQSTVVLQGTWGAQGSRQAPNAAFPPIVAYPTPKMPPVQRSCAFIFEVFNGPCHTEVSASASCAPHSLNPFIICQDPSSCNYRSLRGRYPR